MGLPRLVKMVGVVALIAGIIGLLLPGDFVLFPLLSDLLTKYGEAMFKGISSNPAIKMLILKAPAIILILVGGGMIFWGSMKELLESPDAAGAKAQDPKKTIKDLVDANKKDGGKSPDSYKSVKELVGGPKKP